ncbi:hypothetical protein COW36_17370 [bacterium (Candidatus Blackallbacteria) CG17_big_fil_post_rev_8_21_14_2_50_48_46]|uniref:Flagellar assembly protein T C-terminal domain-containing protein n=1 Tax=bacterium (Candidatus Blackallbacteria) CG17_big_fil_post_rev_8_21_14_2_50_48_46 TaxID=2014261 RepID=A0A2M7G0H9_9BACT|nr:MAG: hypothetical protein COW64_01360 [bacterium (Candidatus Blackallbacteria) CG18_big_fil_WC_8_21_14_2_50_49_26]PIW15192.1 MAG: hypothetical protein COW36_17370 [bacterium (Candidatus Blackallbacteria) CG17_big_fil_post_rev_8_21_14_2_50_48_46]PIW44779.1 MAG: hypothetical protein COW20_22705 [bacterium (Candidatus Blackallbacteria) CG13_big_fil_rev_8_21_14_2_50_49_14]
MFHKKTHLKILALATLLPLFSLSWSPSARSAGKGVTRPLGSGTVNWSTSMIRVTGSGAPPAKGSAPQKRLMAKRAAITDGYRQLAEAVNGVRVFSETTVKNFVTESDVIRLQVQAVIKGARVVGQTRYLSDGSVEVDIEMPVFGSDSLAQGLDFGKSLQKEMSKPYSMLDGRLAFIGPLLRLAPPPKKPQPERGKRWQQAQGAGYTGLIIDASGLGAEPAMGPFIIGAAKRIHPNNAIGMDPNLIVQQGPVHYVEDIDEAKSDNDRIGANPLVIEAKAAQGNPANTDILLDDAAAKKVLEANQQGHFLDSLKVTLVI